MGLPARTDQQRADRLAAWLSERIRELDLSAKKVADRGGISRQHVDWLANGRNRDGAPNRPQPLTLWALAKGLATDGLGRLDRGRAKSYYLEMLDQCGFLPTDDPEAIRELDQLVAQARTEGIEIVVGRVPGLPWTQAGTDYVRGQLDRRREIRRRAAAAPTTPRVAQS